MVNITKLALKWHRCDGFNNENNKLGLSCAKLSKKLELVYFEAGQSFAFFSINIGLEMTDIL